MRYSPPVLHLPPRPQSREDLLLWLVQYGIDGQNDPHGALAHARRRRWEDTTVGTPGSYSGCAASGVRLKARRESTC